MHKALRRRGRRWHRFARAKSREVGWRAVVAFLVVAWLAWRTARAQRRAEGKKLARHVAIGGWLR